MSMSGLHMLQRLAAGPFPTFSRPHKLLLTSSLALLLAACGGGGGGKLGTIDPNNIPTPPPAPETLYRIGTGAGDSFQEGVINASHTTLRAGESTLLRVNVVDGNGQPVVGGVEVAFSSACIATGMSTISGTTVVTPGLLSASYVNSSCSGTDTLVAKLPNNKSATIVLNVQPAQALTVSHISSTNEQLVLGGMGGVETSEVLFRLAGPQNVPIVGKSIRFSISSSAGQATILPGWESGLTDHEGNVRTIIRSGTVAGPITVVATDNETGIQGHAQDITISTGVAVANRFSLSMNTKNPADAFDTDGEVVVLTVTVTDIFGNPPIDGTRVSFVAPYVGLVDDFCVLERGSCSVDWSSQGDRAANGYRSIVLAYMDGAEAFNDLNGNSVFDAQDKGQFSDLPEPFADKNNNGVYDAGEFFFDANKNGIWDIGNGVWDGPCLSALNPVALCPGMTTIAIFAQFSIVMPTNTAEIHKRGSFPAPSASVSVNAGGYRTLRDMVIGDNNGNPLPHGSVVSFTVEGSGVQLQGLTSTTIGSTTRADSDLIGVTLAADELPEPAPTNPLLCPSNPAATSPFPSDCFPVSPTNVRLVLTITFPTDAPPKTYTWPVNVTNF